MLVFPKEHENNFDSACNQRRLLAITRLLANPKSTNTKVIWLIKPFIVFAEAGQLKVKKNIAMCHLFMKALATFDQKLLHTFNKKVEKHLLMKNVLMA